MATDTPIVMGGTIIPYEYDAQGLPMARMIMLDAGGNPNATGTPILVQSVNGTDTPVPINVTNSQIQTFMQLQGGGGKWYSAYVPYLNGSNGTNIAPVGDYLYESSNNGWYAKQTITGTSGVPATPSSGLHPIYITTATTTLVKTGPGVVGTLANATGLATGTVQIYDNTAASGNMLWQGQMGEYQVLPIGMPVNTGIVIVTTAIQNISVSYA